MYWIIHFISEFLSTFKVVSTKQITLSQCVWIMSLGYYYIGKPSLQLFVFCINKIKVISYWLFNILWKPLIEKKTDRSQLQTNPHYLCQFEILKLECSVDLKTDLSVHFILIILKMYNHWQAYFTYYPKFIFCILKIVLIGTYRWRIW